MNLWVSNKTVYEDTWLHFPRLEPKQLKIVLPYCSVIVSVFFPCLIPSLMALFGAILHTSKRLQNYISKTVGTAWQIIDENIGNILVELYSLTAKLRGSSRYFVIISRNTSKNSTFTPWCEWLRTNFSHVDIVLWNLTLKNHFFKKVGKQNLTNMDWTNIS